MSDRSKSAASTIAAKGAEAALVPSLASIAVAVTPCTNVFITSSSDTYATPFLRYALCSRGLERLEEVANARCEI